MTTWQKDEEWEIHSPSGRQPNDDDASETILYEESVTLLDDEPCIIGEGSAQTKEPKEVFVANLALSFNMSQGGIDDSDTVLSKTLLGDVNKLKRDESSVQEEENPEAILDEKSRPKESGHIGNLRNQKTTPGPNETIYYSKYASFVKRTIREFDHKYPGRLRDYRSLSPAEQSREQERVLALLSRLGIGRGSDSTSQNHRRNPHESDSPVSNSLNRDELLNDTMSPFLFSDYHSPPKKEERYNASKHTGDSIAKSYCFPPASSSSESIDPPRATRDSSESPSGRTPIHKSPEGLLTTNPCKRQASTSAKRGADLYRKKYNEEVMIPLLDDASLSSHTLSEGLSTRMGRLSISPAGSDPKDIFPASQSPISPKLTYGSDSDESSVNTGKPGSKNGLRQGKQSQHIGMSDETIESSTTYGMNKRQVMREIPVNLGMKVGSTFHIEKLDVRRCEITDYSKRGARGMGRRLINFQDPLSKYNKQQQGILNEVVESLRRSEIDGNCQPGLGTSSANVLFSLTYNQIIDLCLRLLLDDEQMVRDPGSTRKGRNVIITRDKGELKLWERALHEGTGFSVFNHAEAPLSERVRLSTSEKAGKYDVVLTTYDALKGPDVAIPIDALGYAIVSSPDEESGWLNSRTTLSQPSQPQRCRQLSVLHRLNFRRAIFVDCLGRKSFLAKNGTSRASAAVALQANSRIVFFARSDADGESAFRALKKSDRHATQSLSAILHLPARGNISMHGEDDESENEEVDPLETCSLDLKGLV